MTTDDRYDIDLGDYLRALLHWWWIAAVLAAVGAVVAAGVTTRGPRPKWPRAPSTSGSRPMRDARHGREHRELEPIVWGLPQPVVV